MFQIDFAGLPSGIDIGQHELTIRFEHPHDLLEKLLALSQAPGERLRELRSDVERGQPMSADIADQGERTRLRALLEAATFASPEPISLKHLARAVGHGPEFIQELLVSIVADYDRPEHDMRLRTVGGGYQFGTKPEHHEGLKGLAVNLRPPLPLSKQAVETAAVVAMLQPVTAKQIRDARHVRNDNVLKTLLHRKPVAPAGRAKTRRRPLQYRTTQRFLIDFGLNDLSELLTIEEFRHLPGMLVDSE